VNRNALTDALKEEAIKLGFDLAGTCRAVTPPGIVHFDRWLASGYAGEMHYIADRAEAYRHPRSVLDGVQSLLMLALVYRTVEPNVAHPGEGRISRYAWGRDYHDLIHDRLHKLADFHRRLVPGASVRGVVDSAPLLEREFAQLAGLGWIGKNTLLLNQKRGSWFFLAALLTTEELVYDEPATDHCGTCRACLDACPTGALVGPWQLDARRCISYLTIELRDAIPIELRQPAGDWLFGCDVCQDVCPWNRRAPTTEEPSLQPGADANPISLSDLFSLTDAAFRARFRGTPLWRAKRRGLLRNAAIVLGNRPHPAARAGLLLGLRDPEPLVRAAAAWALGRYADLSAHKALGSQLAVESDPDAKREMEAALARRPSSDGA
jgi:epoxyqueuosine reductase